MSKITTLFLDIGGVLMTNGWDRHMREKAALDFDLNLVSLENRHREFYNIYETGKSSLDDYLKKVVFDEEQSFSLEKFKDYILSQSKPFPEMIEFFSQIKKDFNLRVAAISNEGREIAEYRIKTAKLATWIDDFFISAFVGYQKPDLHIFKMALDVTQVSPNEALYVDDREEHIIAAAKLGINGIQFKSFKEMRKILFERLEKSGGKQI